LRARFEASVLTTPQDASGAVTDVIRLCPDDDPARVVSDLERIEPCGHKNPAPRFVIDAEVQRARMVKGGHLSLELGLAHGRRIRAFAVDMGERASELSGPVRLVGKLRRDTWIGGDAVEVLVSAILD
jgi:single-stranded DNA-specific DHH superfamily exonuclease